MLSASSKHHNDDRRNPRWCNAIQLPHQEAHQLADELADLDEDEQHDDREHRGQRVVPELQPRHTVEVAHLVLPDVEVDDHQDLADDADDDHGEPRPARCVRAGILRPHVPHQPHREDAEPVTDRARRAADQPWKSGPRGSSDGVNDNHRNTSARTVPVNV